MKDEKGEKLPSAIFTPGVHVVGKNRSISKTYVHQCNQIEKQCQLELHLINRSMKKVARDLTTITNTYSSEDDLAFRMQVPLSWSATEGQNAVRKTRMPLRKNGGGTVNTISPSPAPQTTPAVLKARQMLEKRERAKQRVLSAGSHQTSSTPGLTAQHGNSLTKQAVNKETATRLVVGVSRRPSRSAIVSGRYGQQWFHLSIPPSQSPQHEGSKMKGSLVRPRNNSKRIVPSSADRKVGSVDNPWADRSFVRRAMLTLELKYQESLTKRCHSLPQTAALKSGKSAAAEDLGDSNRNSEKKSGKKNSRVSFSEEVMISEYNEHEGHRKSSVCGTTQLKSAGNTGNLDGEASKIKSATTYDDLIEDSVGECSNNGTIQILDNSDDIAPETSEELVPVPVSSESLPTGTHIPGDSCVNDGVEFEDDLVFTSTDEDKTRTCIEDDVLFRELECEQSGTPHPDSATVTSTAPKVSSPHRTTSRIKNDTDQSKKASGRLLTLRRSWSGLKEVTEACLELRSQMKDAVANLQVNTSKTTPSVEVNAEPMDDMPTEAAQDLSAGEKSQSKRKVSVLATEARAHQRRSSVYLKRILKEERKSRSMADRLKMDKQMREDRSKGVVVGEEGGDSSEDEDEEGGEGNNHNNLQQYWAQKHIAHDPVAREWNQTVA